MIRLLAIGLVGGASLMSAASAGPCVGAGYDLPFPGATGVETLRADVPSALFPGLWQQGLIDGYTYQIFANTTGVLQEDLSPSAWSIALDCRQSLCIREVTGSPPGLAWSISQRIEHCLAPSIVLAPTALSEPTMASAPTKPAPTKPDLTEPSPTKPAMLAPVPLAPAVPTVSAETTDKDTVTMGPH